MTRLRGEPAGGIGVLRNLEHHVDGAILCQQPHRDAPCGAPERASVVRGADYGLRPAHDAGEIAPGVDRLAGDRHEHRLGGRGRLLDGAVGVAHGVDDRVNLVVAQCGGLLCRLQL